MSLVVCRGVTKRHYYVSHKETIMSLVVCRGSQRDTIMSLVVCRGVTKRHYDIIMSLVVCRGGSHVSKRHYYVSSCL